MIYVTLGTMHLGFPRLIRKMDEIAQSTGEKVILQTGLDPTIPAHCEAFDFKPREEVLELQHTARLIVCHGGIGSIIDALLSTRPLIVVPRLKRFNEHNDDHQLDLAHAVEGRKWGRTLLDIDELPAACADPPPAHANYTPAKAPLLEAVRKTIASFV